MYCTNKPSDDDNPTTTKCMNLVIKSKMCIPDDWLRFLFCNLPFDEKKYKILDYNLFCLQIQKQQITGSVNIVGIGLA